MSLKCAPASRDTNRCPLPILRFLSSSPGGVHSRRYPPTATRTVRGLLGSILTDVMYRFGSPAAFAMCHPLEVYSAGFFFPPTFVASPLLNTPEPGPITSHAPQYPTYAFGPTRSMADPMFCGSPDDVAVVVPGCFCVPSGKSTFQSLEDVPGPDPVSSTCAPGIITCSGL